MANHMMNMAAQVSLQPNVTCDTIPNIFSTDDNFDNNSAIQGSGNVKNEDEHSQDDCIEDEVDESSTDEDDYDEDWDVREQLNTDLSLIKRTGKAYAYFRPTPCAPNPGLEIAGLRRFGMPLQPQDISEIIAASHRAPYGKGTETIVNEAVRKTWEIDGDRINLRHPAWPDELNKIVATACDQLGVAGGINAVEAQLYKLLVYEEGAMFKPHKELVPHLPSSDSMLTLLSSEKAPRMFGTLVVCLPSLHTGGELIVSFNGERQSLASAPYATPHLV